jgi:hypothetical protein
MSEVREVALMARGSVDNGGGDADVVEVGKVIEVLLVGG